MQVAVNWKDIVQGDSRQKTPKKWHILASRGLRNFLKVAFCRLVKLFLWLLFEKCSMLCKDRQKMEQWHIVFCQIIIIHYSKFTKT